MLSNFRKLHPCEIIGLMYDHRHDFSQAYKLIAKWESEVQDFDFNKVEKDVHDRLANHPKKLLIYQDITAKSKEAHSIWIYVGAFMVWQNILSFILRLFDVGTDINQTYRYL